MRHGALLASLVLLLGSSTATAAGPGSQSRLRATARSSRTCATSSASPCSVRPAQAPVREALGRRACASIASQAQTT